MKLVIIFGSLLLVSLFTIQESFSQEDDLFCNEGKILVYRVMAEKYACLNPPTADKWYQSGIAEPVKQMMPIIPLHPEKMTSSAPVPETATGPSDRFL